MSERLQATVNTFAPDDGQRYCYYDLKRQKVATTTMKSSDTDILRYLLGNIHKTEAEARQWARDAERELEEIYDLYEARSLLDRVGLNYEARAMVVPAAQLMKAWREIRKHTLRGGRSISGAWNRRAR